MSKTPRCGIYIGEPSRAIHELAADPYKDEEAFSQKSRTVKQLILKHTGLSELPTYRFTRLVQFRDGLFRQRGETLKILYNKDLLINTKAVWVKLSNKGNSP